MSWWNKGLQIQSRSKITHPEKNKVAGDRNSCKPCYISANISNSNLNSWYCDCDKNELRLFHIFEVWNRRRDQLVFSLTWYQ